MKDVPGRQPNGMKQKKVWRRKRIRPVSKRREKLNREYRKLRDEFLRNRHCECCPVARPGEPPAMAVDVHHTRGRIGKNLLDVTTWKAVCRKCHNLIHDYPYWARCNGMMLSRLAKVEYELSAAPESDKGPTSRPATPLFGTGSAE